MNNIFPSFDFDKWLKSLVGLLSSFDTSPKQVKEEEKILEFCKINFFEQNHKNFDEYEIDFCDEYLYDITRLNQFMKYISSQNNTLEDIVFIILYLKYPFLSNQRAIAKVLLSKKSYNFSYKGNDVLIHYKIVQRIKQFIQDLQIPIH